MKRVTQSSQRPLAKRSRTLPLRGNATRGDGLDAGRYYKCWNCGFICDKDRDQEGGPESMDGVTHEEYFPMSEPTAGAAAVAALCPDQFDIAAVRVDAEGTALPVYRYYQPVVGAGCPACGTLNWRGLYP